MNIILKKIKNNHTRIRTDEIQGVASKLPKVGKQFFMKAKPLTPNTAVRLVNTSVVTQIENFKNGWRLHTESGSIYDVHKAPAQ